MPFPNTVSYQPSAVCPHIFNACPDSAVPMTAEFSSGSSYTILSCKTAAASVTGTTSFCCPCTTAALPAADTESPVPRQHQRCGHKHSKSPCPKALPAPKPFFPEFSFHTRILFLLFFRNNPFLPRLEGFYLVFKKTASRCAFSSSGYSARYCSIASFALSYCPRYSYATISLNFNDWVTVFPSTFIPA